LQFPPVVELTWMIVQGLPRVLFDPGYALFFWGITAFVYFQYRRTEQLEQERLGVAKNSARHHTMTAIVYGVVGGLFGSWVFVLMGATLSQNDIAYVWPLALALMLVNPRLICFSYAGGLIAVCSALFGWPQVNVAGLLALVAILHVVEGILVWTSGSDCASPVIIRVRDRNVGGFMMQRFWPIPVTIVLALTLPESAAGGGVEMPDWWPLIPPAGGRELLDTLTFLMFPVVAALGYGDVAITCDPRRKSRRAAGYLVLFSVILLGLAVLTVRWPALGLVAGLFSAGGHELMSQMGSRRELQGKPYYDRPDQGVRVLDVLPDSPGEHLGLRSGDIILEVNGQPVNNRDQLRETLLEASFYLELKTQTAGGLVIREHNRYRREEGTLGLILVPEDSYPPDVELKPTGILQSILGRWYRGH